MQRSTDRVGLAKTQKLMAINGAIRTARVNLRVPDDVRERWERAQKALHLPTMTALICFAVGELCDRRGIR